MARYPRYTDVPFSIGPGAPSPVVKLLIIINVVVFLMSTVVPVLLIEFALVPRAVIEQFAAYQLVSYMFLHGGAWHLLFNMLGLWMFGTDLEKTWGSRFFTKYYFVTGIGAALLTIAWSLSPLPAGDEIYNSAVVGASGAIYGVLLAYGMHFPRRIIIFYVFPIQARYYVMIMGAMAFFSSIDSSGGGVAHTAHLGGLAVGYLYLKSFRVRPLQELKYRWLRWRMSRARSRFDVYSGGRGRRDDDDSWKRDWKKHIH